MLETRLDVHRCSALELEPDGANDAGSAAEDGSTTHASKRVGGVAFKAGWE
jgi:hypothetical protein